MSPLPFKVMSTLDAFDFLSGVTSSDVAEWNRAVAQLTDNPPGYLWNIEPLYVAPRSNPNTVNPYRVPERTCMEQALMLVACSHPERLSVLVDFVTGHDQRGSLGNAVEFFATMASAMQKNHGSDHIEGSMDADDPLEESKTEAHMFYSRQT